jgi:hypothetical protein
VIPRAAALLSLALGGCVASPNNLRLEDLPGENVVRIVNPSRHPVRFYRFAEYSAGPRTMLQIRYRDRDGQPVAVDYPVSGGWSTGGMYSENLYPVGQLPTALVTITGRGRLEFPRDSRFVEIMGPWTPGPCPRTTEPAH